MIEIRLNLFKQAAKVIQKNNFNELQDNLDYKYNYIKGQKILQFLINLDIYSPEKGLTPLYKEKDAYGFSEEVTIFLIYIKKTNPRWIKNMKDGRKSVERSLKGLEDTISRVELEICDYIGFFEEEPSEEIERFILHLECLIYNDNDFTKELKLKELGRLGEEASYKFEKESKDTFEIEKTFLNSNKSGYDLKVTKLDGSIKFIEVKSTRSHFDSDIYATLTNKQISTGEDNFNAKINEYVFHFWSFSDGESHLAEIPFIKMKDTLYGIENKKEGVRLNTQEVKFSNFKTEFKKIKFN